MEPAIKPSSDAAVSGWDFLALLGTAGLAALALFLWPRLPDPLPTHWSSAGRINGWTPKAVVPWIMFGLPLFVWLLLGLVGRFAVPKDPRLASGQRRAVAPLRGLLVLGLCVLQSAILLEPAWGPGFFPPLLAVFLGLIALAIVLMARRIRRVLPPEHRALYKWGLFYVNPKDPRLLVPKLMGVGWTFNYARASAWWITALLLLGPLAVAAFTLITAASR